MQIGVQGLLLDLCVLAIVERGDTYGYLLTQSAKDIIGVSESTVYPVMRRLMAQKCLDSYDVPHDGRNRRYYRLTAAGGEMLAELKEGWAELKQIIDIIVKGGNSGE